MPVIVNQALRLFPENLQAFKNRLLRIVRPVVNLAAAAVADAFDARGKVTHMIDPAAVPANPPAGNPVHQDLRRGIQQKNVCYPAALFRKFLIEQLSNQDLPEEMRPILAGIAREAGVPIPGEEGGGGEPAPKGWRRAKVGAHSVMFNKESGTWKWKGRTFGSKKKLVAALKKYDEKGEEGDEDND